MVWEWQNEGFYGSQDPPLNMSLIPSGWLYSWEGEAPKTPPKTLRGKGSFQCKRAKAVVMLAKCLIRPKGAQEKCQRNHETPSVQKKHQNNLAINSSRMRFFYVKKRWYTKPKPEISFPFMQKSSWKKRTSANSKLATSPPWWFS